MNTPKVGRSKAAKAHKEEKREEETFQQTANEYAVRSIAGMRDELDALEHARECDGKCQTCGGVGDLGGEVNGSPEDCPDCTDGKCERGQEKESFVHEGKTLWRQIHEYPEAWHDEERAQRHIEEGPLSVEVRSGWHVPGAPYEPEEYCILLGTGGPAARIIGDLGECNQPETARFEYQDWFKPWTAAQISSEDEATLLAYAQHFYFGE